MNRARSLVKRQLQLWVFLFWFSSSFSSAKTFFTREVTITCGFFLMLVTHKSIKLKRDKRYFFFISMFCAYYHVYEIVSSASLSFKITCTHFNVEICWRNSTEKVLKCRPCPFIQILSWFYSDFVLNLCIQIISRFFINFWKIWIKCGWCWKKYFIQMLSRFFRNSVYPDVICIKLDKIRINRDKFLIKGHGRT